VVRFPRKKNLAWVAAQRGLASAYNAKQMGQEAKSGRTWRQDPANLGDLLDKNNYAFSTPFWSFYLDKLHFIITLMRECIALANPATPLDIWSRANKPGKVRRFFDNMLRGVIDCSF